MDLKKLTQSQQYREGTGLDRFDLLYRNVFKTPKDQAVAGALLGAAAASLLVPHAQETVQAMLLPLTGRNNWPRTQQQFQRRRNITTAVAVLLASGAGAAIPMYWTLGPRSAGGVLSMDSWGTYNKKASLFSSNYDQAVDMFGRVPVADAQTLFTRDPWLTQYDPYAKHLATSIIGAAGGGNNTTTLGSVFDSAVDKLDKKFSVDGLGKAALRTGASYAGAKLFTNALGTMIGLPQKVQDSLVSAGTWAGAISSILN